MNFQFVFIFLFRLTSLFVSQNFTKHWIFKIVKCTWPDSLTRGKRISSLVLLGFVFSFFLIKTCKWVQGLIHKFQEFLSYWMNFQFWCLYFSLDFHCSLFHKTLDFKTVKCTWPDSLTWGKRIIVLVILGFVFPFFLSKRF